MVMFVSLFYLMKKISFFLVSFHCFGHQQIPMLMLSNLSYWSKINFPLKIIY